MSDQGFKKVGAKKRRGRKHKIGRPHSGHRNAGARTKGSLKRQVRVDRKRRLQQLRTPEVDL